MSDKITFEAEEQAIEFVNQFPHYDFARKGRIVTGAFDYLYLRYAKLAGANLDGNFKRTWFVGADLSDAGLGGTNLTWTNFEGANLRCAYLEDAILDGANINGANLSHANLEGANLRNVDGKNADLAMTIMKNADLSGGIFHRATFEGARLEGANLTGAVLNNARVSGTTILSISVIGLLWGDKIYASPIHNEDGNQTDWGFHIGSLYGTYGDLREAIVRKYGEGEYSNCLDKLQEMCLLKFNPQQEQQS